MKISSTPLLLAVAAVLALSSCKDSTGPKTPNSGTMSFQYSGSVSGSGSFSASGVVPAQATDHPAFVAAVRDTVDGEPFIAVIGFQALASGRTNMLDLELREPSGAATLSLDDACGTSTSLAGCAVALIALNYDLTTSSSVAGEQTYLADAGSVRVTSISSTRVRGTFTGHAVDESANGFTMSGGSFDVPIISASALPSRSPAASKVAAVRLSALRARQ